jgi:hypothetical protein
MDVRERYFEARRWPELIQEIFGFEFLNLWFVFSGLVN